MRFERMVMQAGDNSFTLGFHPRMTVVAGVGKVERESIVAELIGALGAGRSGVHLELAFDDGRRLAVFRPDGGRHRVVDIDDAADVSAEFTTADGGVDLLQTHGFDLRQARRKMRLSPGDLTAHSEEASRITQLAALDQELLWEAAADLRGSDEALQSEAVAFGSAPEDAEMIEEVEQRHQRFAAAEERHERMRRKSIAVAALCAIASVPMTIVAPTFAIPLLGLALATTFIGVLFRHRVNRARKGEAEALAAAGAQSYLGFHLQRVNHVLNSGAARRRFIEASENHREAQQVWNHIAGETDVDWAIDHQEEILAAARLRRDINNLGAIAPTNADIDDDRTTDIARVLVNRLGELRRTGLRGESFPLILDEPFAALDPSMKPPLLELLGTNAGSPQLIFLTEDEEVASWARLEALTGTIQLVEASETTAEEAPKGRGRRGRGRDHSAV